MSNAPVRLSIVTLDMTNAMELSELLDYLAQWLELADYHVRADLTAFAWDQTRSRLSVSAWGASPAS